MSLQVVLMGVVGSGKTSYYNKLTNSTESVLYGGKSLTQNVFMKSAAYGEVKFNVLDTPGFGAISSKMDHAAGVVAALTEGPLNRILILIKYDRIENMKKHAIQVLAPVSRYRGLITFVITSWDLAEKQGTTGEHKTLIEETFQKYNIKSYIYSSFNDTGAQACQKVVGELRKSPPEQIDLLLNEQAASFELAEFDDELDLDVEQSKTDLLILFRAKAQAIGKYIENYSSSQADLIDVMHALSIEIKKVAEETLKKFEDDNKELCEERIAKGGKNYIFLFHVYLKQQMQADIQYVIQLAQEKMHETGQYFFKNIRKCECGLIWMKVQGCDGNTICGAVPDKTEKIQDSAPQKWQIEWIKNEKGKIVNVDVKLLPRQTLTKDGEQQFKQMQGKKYKIDSTGNKIEDQSGEYLVGGKGCGKVIYWAQMKELGPAEKNELADSGLLDYFCNEDKKISQELEKARKPFEEQLKLAVDKQKAKIVRRK